eukprot:TRINITY_DN10367_c0_g1_i3.p2 TRINITY_DN10367_c0_g1~~TRINITY_DN10367_c0_g1_i3.p2  ORF type:complete len:172 (+),score=24.44 TRINITY_DN10367_c0_g1_i3:702-1217(+)
MLEAFLDGILNLLSNEINIHLAHENFRIHNMKELFINLVPNCMEIYLFCTVFMQEHQPTSFDKWWFSPQDSQYAQFLIDKIKECVLLLHQLQIGAEDDDPNINAEYEWLRDWNEDYLSDLVRVSPLDERIRLGVSIGYLDALYDRSVKKISQIGNSQMTCKKPQLLSLIHI